ncbi:villin-1 isoform X2 [Latimeria chalumnae]|uniref:villin-1 isoform X2 n=1 Tax=Latimeria chalumnae TaxID=7897 RepID=UPI00313D52A4
MTTEIPEAFRSIEKTPGLQIWTIEKLEMVPVPTKAYGNFFEGDCYIVLSIKKTRSGTSSDIHYWIGKESSQDEQGAAAIYITQMDDFLGGSPIQYREVQGSESEAFKSYFKKGIVYKKGGVASGFRHVETNMYNIRRLLHVKGRKNISATEVDLSWNSFNKGDVFLLDLGKVIVQWNGPLSRKMERIKGLRLAQDIRDRERGGRAQIGIIDSEEESSCPELMKVLTAVLGERRGDLSDPTPDETADLHQKANVRLYHVSDSNGNLIVQEIATQPLTQDLLQEEDCHILDQGGAKIFVWKGSKASVEERRAAFSRAVGFIKAKNYPASTNVEVVHDGAEPAMFQQLFQNWKVKGQTQGLGRTHSVGKIAKVEQTKFDVNVLHACPELAAEKRMVDDASGKVEIWRIEDLELQEVDPKTYGQFYGGDCYLVLYTYLKSNRPHYILYCWQGRHATQDEITASAYQAVNKDNEYGGEPVQVFVKMGKEPRHFLAIFKGKLIIYEGGTGRGGKQQPDSSPRLFQVRGSNEYNTRATEVPPRASSLNSNDIFLLKDHISYMWCGKGCSGDEREMAKIVGNIISKHDKQTVLEGQEPPEFWVALGGRGPYASEKRFQEEDPVHELRLFECSNQTGRFIMTEVLDFAQDDLDEEDIMLLDTWEELFLWIGKSANETEKMNSIVAAREYLQTHPARRDLDMPIMMVKQGHEPLTFTGWFNAWDLHKWNSCNSYDEMKNNFNDVSAITQITVNLQDTDLNSKSDTSTVHRVPVRSNSPVAPGGPTVYQAHVATVEEAYVPEVSGCYPSYLLINKTVDELPEGVDPTRKEILTKIASMEGDVKSEVQVYGGKKDDEL